MAYLVPCLATARAIHCSVVMTDCIDCTPANTIKVAEAGQAAKQLIQIQLFKHKTVQEVWREWQEGGLCMA